MNIVKILWFTNIPLDNDIASTGSWLIALSKKITENENYELINISSDYIDSPIFTHKYSTPHLSDHRISFLSLVRFHCKPLSVPGTGSVKADL